MDTVSLPLLQASDTVHHALARMKALERGGVVVNQGESYRLLHARELLRARQACVQLLSEVAGGEHVDLFSQVDVKQHEVDLVRPMRTTIQYDNAFKAKESKFAVIGADRDTAMVVTSSEAATFALRSTGGYQCSRTPPEEHYFPMPRVSAGETCPDCLKPGGVIQLAP